MASRSNKMKKLFCLSLLTIAAATPADARWKEVPGLTMRTFVTNCEAMGGTIDEGGNPNVLKCKLPSGTVITCDFGSSPPYCGPDRRTPRKDLNDLFGNSVRPIDPATGGRTPKLSPAMVLLEEIKTQGQARVILYLVQVRERTVSKMGMQVEDLL
jgi:hypothetical protein